MKGRDGVRGGGGVWGGAWGQVLIRRRALLRAWVLIQRNTVYLTGERLGRMKEWLKNEKEWKYGRPWIDLLKWGSNSGKEQVKNRTWFIERTNQWIKNVSFKERGRVKHRDVKRVNIPLTKCCVGFCIPYVLSLVFQRMYTFLNSFRTWRFFKIKQDCENE